jgi:predicted ArsR family transcriptional regulator
MRIDAAFLASTRGRIADLLRRASRTVDELAGELGVTDNAVRPHLAALERDGIIRSTGVRRGRTAGKPATLYEIDPAAEPAFSQAYLPLLTALLSSLGDRMSEREFRALMRDVGHRLAGQAPSERGTLRARAETASRILNQLGGATSVEEGDKGAMIVRGCGCPLSVAVVERAEVCLAVQTMLSDVIGVPVSEQCDRADRVHCRFEIHRS